MPDFIIGIFEPCIIPIPCTLLIIPIIALSHPRMPSLAIAALIIARCLFISHLCGPSGVAAIIVDIADRCVPEQGVILAEAGLATTIAAARQAAVTTAYFIVNRLKWKPTS